MSTPADSVSVRVPGSTSNCGAGFDTLGMALNLYNRVTVARVSIAGIQPATTEDAGALTMVDATSGYFFQKAKVGAFGFSYRIAGDVPMARGLGSSVTVRAGIAAGLNELSGKPLSQHQLVEVVTHLEGHPDNAAAAILGGFCVARCDATSGEYIDAIKIEVPEDIAFVVASPKTEVLTKESRGILPQTLPYFDAVKSINSAAYLVAAFATQDYRRLKNAVSDFMHEPYLMPRIVGARSAIEAGIAAGVFTGWLSGSGSSVLCVVPRDQAQTVAGAMRASLEAENAFGEIFVLGADNQGIVIG